MLIQIVTLLLQVFVSIVAGACLLRCYLQWLAFNLGVGQSKSIGAYILPLTNWIVIPLRRIIPSLGRFDTASFISAYLLVLAKTIVISIMLGMTPWGFAWPMIALMQLLDLAISGLIGLVLINVVLSWLSNGSQLQILIAILLEPLLRPIRRKIPNFGALDLSPLVLLLSLQILQIVLNSIKLGF